MHVNWSMPRLLRCTHLSRDSPFSITIHGGSGLPFPSIALHSNAETVESTTAFVTFEGSAHALLMQLTAPLVLAVQLPSRIYGYYTSAENGTPKENILQGKNREDRPHLSSQATAPTAAKETHLPSTLSKIPRHRGRNWCSAEAASAYCRTSSLNALLERNSLMAASCLDLILVANCTTACPAPAPSSVNSSFAQCSATATLSLIYT